MILFGRRDKYLATREIPSEVCDECKKRGGVVSIFQIYFHILKVPVIPLTRRVASQCYHCRHVKVEKHFTDQQKSVGALLKKEVKTPYWTMIGGSILLTGLIVKLIIKWL